jgi:hypothetical protein
VKTDNDLLTIKKIKRERENVVGGTGGKKKKEEEVVLADVS